MTPATVIGDVFFDHVSDLSSAGDLPPALGRTDFDAAANVAGLVGGGAVQFAIAAIRAGFAPVTVIGKAGGSDNGELDPGGTAALAALREAGVEPLLARGRNMGTGRAMIVYLPGDHRFMVSDTGANAAFEFSDINDAMWQAVAHRGLIHVSGYALVHSARRLATLELVEAARSAGATIAIDVVPHDIDRFVNPEAIRSALSCADWIISSGNAARRLLGAGPAVPEQLLLADLARFAGTVALFQHPSRATVLCGSMRREYRFEYTPGPASRGQSADSQAQLLARYLLPVAAR